MYVRQQLNIHPHSAHQNYPSTCSGGFRGCQGARAPCAPTLDKERKGGRAPCAPRLREKRAPCAPFYEKKRVNKAQRADGAIVRQLDGLKEELTTPLTKIF